MPNFVVKRQNSDGASTSVLEKSAATTDIVQGQFCTIDAATGLAIKALAAHTSIAYVMAVLSSTRVLVLNDASTVFQGTADAPFALTQRNTEVDIAIDGSGNQTIDVGASATDVFKVISSEDAGTVGSALEVLVMINKPISL